MPLPVLAFLLVLTALNAWATSDNHDGSSECVAGSCFSGVSDVEAS